MNAKVDVDSKTASLEVAKSMYSLEAVQIAAHVFDARCEVRAADAGKTFELELVSKKRQPTAADLEALAGEFLNELLNQEYRFIVAKFNQKISSLIVTQTLFAARGGENPPGPAPEEQTPEFKAEVAALMKKAADEIARTMPKKLPPQGNPLPPAREEQNV